jgi:hypothetical protein
MRHSQAEQEDAGEGYFASISDLMVGILFIFLLMLTVFAINYADEDKDKKIDTLEKQVAALTMERDALLASSREKDIEIARLKNEITRLIADRDRLRNGLADLLKQLDGVSVGLQESQERSARIRDDLLLRFKRELDTATCMMRPPISPYSSFRSAILYFPSGTTMAGFGLGGPIRSTRQRCSCITITVLRSLEPACNFPRRRTAIFRSVVPMA